MIIACVVPPLHFPVNELGHGYQPPLGLLAISGPLIDCGYEVSLIDADAAHLTTSEVIEKLSTLGADVVLVGHSGSMAANPAAVQLIDEIKHTLPGIKTVYGGVYPTYAFSEIMGKHRSVDFIVLGEGEEAILSLVKAIESGDSPACVHGVVWRSGENLVMNSRRIPLNCLDDYRVAWELVDWSLYPARHSQGHSAIVQFSRGCPHTCTYCGQWMFWKRWRHRSVESFVDDLQILHDRYQVRSIWIADENIGVDANVFHTLLNAIISRRLALKIFCALRSDDVIRDRNHVALYRRAGVVCLMMGIESLDDDVLVRIHKGSRHTTTQEAIDILRQHGILSVVNVMYGLRDETPLTIAKTLFQLTAMAPDYYNALHWTPLSWTPDAKHVDPQQIVQLDQRLWNFRVPVVRPKYFSPKTLGMVVKLTEAAFYLRPWWVLARLFLRNEDARAVFRDSLIRLWRVYLFEWRELMGAQFHNKQSHHKASLNMLLPRRRKLSITADDAQPIIPPDLARKAAQVR